MQGRLVPTSHAGRQQPSSVKITCQCSRSAWALQRREDITGSRQTGSSDRGKGYLTLARQPLEAVQALARQSRAASAPVHGKVESGFFSRISFPGNFPTASPLACGTLRSKPQRERERERLVRPCRGLHAANNGSARRLSNTAGQSCLVIHRLHSLPAAEGALMSSGTGSELLPASYPPRAKMERSASSGRVGAKRGCVADAAQPLMALRSVRPAVDPFLADRCTGSDALCATGALRSHGARLMGEKKRTRADLRVQFSTSASACSLAKLHSIFEGFFVGRRSGDARSLARSSVALQARIAEGSSPSFQTLARPPHCARLQCTLVLAFQPPLAILHARVTSEKQASACPRKASWPTESHAVSEARSHSHETSHQRFIVSSREFARQDRAAC